MFVVLWVCGLRLFCVFVLGVFVCLGVLATFYLVGAASVLWAVWVVCLLWFPGGCAVYVCFARYLICGWLIAVGLVAFY